MILQSNLVTLDSQANESLVTYRLPLWTEPNYEFSCTLEGRSYVIEIFTTITESSYIKISSDGVVLCDYADLRCYVNLINLSWIWIPGLQAQLFFLELNSSMQINKTTYNYLDLESRIGLYYANVR